MSQEQIAERLKIALHGAPYSGTLTSYAAKSIEDGRSNYPVSNLITYCSDMNLKMVMFDLTTEDRFFPTSILEVHKVLDLLMRRYNVDYKLVYRKTAVHYTAPKSFDECKLEKLKADSKNKKSVAPLSIKTLLAVCEVIHCDLLFESN